MPNTYLLIRAYRKEDAYTCVFVISLFSFSFSNSEDKEKYRNFFSTHQKFCLVDVFGFSVGIFDFFGEYQIQFEEENVSIFGFFNDLFLVDHLKA